jgi:diguanylate cyclase (GGDEF)-like protein
MQPRKSRHSEEIILLILSGSIFLGILPFLVIRLMENHWALAALDGLAMAIGLVIFIYVWFSHKTLLARWFIALSCVIIMCGTLYLKGFTNVLWVYPSLSIVFFLLSAYRALALSSVFLILACILLWSEMTRAVAIQFMVTAFSMLAFCFSFAFTMQKQQRTLTLAATQDPLTGTGNRRALEERLLKLIHKLRQKPHLSACIIIIDLDKFKAVNDEYGHATGDEVLKKFTHIVKKHITNERDLYRFGGEEFVIVADKIALNEAEILAELVRKAVSSNNHLPVQQLTISLGVAQYQANESSYQWFERADQALYQAKSKGRNLYCLAEPH